MIILTQDQVLSMHKDMIQKFGGSSRIRDAKLLESALNAPFQSVLGQDAYPSLIQKAARIDYGIISNHPFVDGINVRVLM